MSSRKHQVSQELLDLPLSGREDPALAPEGEPGEQRSAGPDGGGRAGDPRNLDLFADYRSARSGDVAAEAPPAVASDPLAGGPAGDEGVREVTPRDAPAVTRSNRLLAGLLDLGVLGLIVALGLLLAGASPGALPARAWAGPVGFLLVLSFVYLVFSLAFWGRTPGMMVARLIALDDGGDSLTGGQCVKRWLAAVLTAAFLGVPLVLFSGPRSLADRWSASVTARR